MKKKAGRPIGSEIRQNIVEILYFLGKGYAYQIYKIYSDIFPKVTMRVVYYHLKKGASLDEFNVIEIKKEKGEYSWGQEVERIYYSLGNNAKPRLDPQVKEYFDKKHK